MRKEEVLANELEQILNYHNTKPIIEFERDALILIINALRRPTRHAPDFAPESRTNCTYCGGLLPKHNLPCEMAQSR